jgi:hypothetical protein
MKRYGPPRRRTQDASAVLRIFVRHPKKTFATISALFGSAVMSGLNPQMRTQAASADHSEFMGSRPS